MMPKTNLGIDAVIADAVNATAIPNDEPRHRAGRPSTPLGCGQREESCRIKRRAAERNLPTAASHDQRAGDGRNRASKPNAVAEGCASGGLAFRYSRRQRLSWPQPTMLTTTVSQDPDGIWHPCGLTHNR
jgi:hypothetical protein